MLAVIQISPQSRLSYITIFLRLLYSQKMRFSTSLTDLFNQIFNWNLPRLVGRSLYEGHVSLFYHLSTRGGGGYSGFLVTGMIEWGQKSKPKKSLDQKSTHKKSHAEFPSLKNFQKGLHDITRTTQSALPRILRFFWVPKNIPTWIKPHTKKYVPIPESKISNPKKSFNHPPSEYPSWAYSSTQIL